MKAIDAVFGANIRNTQNTNTGTIFLTGYRIRPGVYGVRVHWSNGRRTSIAYETLDKNTTQYELVQERVVAPSTENFVDWSPWYESGGYGYLKFIGSWHELVADKDLVLYNPKDPTQFFKPSEHPDLATQSPHRNTPDVWMIGLNPLGRQVNANA